MRPQHNEGRVMKYQSLGDHWASSLFMSQDPVAIDSVGLDFVRNEPTADECRGMPENYLHEAALADKPPSGTVYDPNQDGKPVASLGVHEHWNNATDRQYSRNLGKREGIELVAWPRLRGTAEIQDVRNPARQRPAGRRVEDSQVWLLCALWSGWLARRCAREPRLPGFRRAGMGGRWRCLAAPMTRRWPTQRSAGGHFPMVRPRHAQSARGHAGQLPPAHFQRRRRSRAREDSSSNSSKSTRGRLANAAWRFWALFIREPIRPQSHQPPLMRNWTAWCSRESSRADPGLPSNWRRRCARRAARPW